MPLQWKPPVWTIHHTHRLFHLSLLAVAAFVTLAAIWAGLVLVWQAQGESGEVALSAVVPQITSPPSTIVSGDSAPPPTSPVAKPAPKEAPKLSVEFSPNQPLESGRVPTALSSFPRFIGHTNIPRANIFLEIRSTVVIRGMTHADSSGYWQWQSPEALPSGSYTVTARAEDPESSNIKASASLAFAVNLPADAPKVAKTKPLLTPAPDSPGPLFDVLLTIPEQFRSIAPGSEVVVNVKLLNFGAPGKPVDVGVEYSIEDSGGILLFHSTETVAVSTQVSLLKTFAINRATNPGRYKVTAKVPSQGVIAVASDTFEVKAFSAPLPASPPKKDFATVFQLLLTLLFAFTIIVYFEYNKVTMLSRAIKQVTEQDLLNQVR